MFYKQINHSVLRFSRPLFKYVDGFVLYQTTFGDNGVRSCFSNASKCSECLSTLILPPWISQQPFIYSEPLTTVASVKYLMTGTDKNQKGNSHISIYHLKPESINTAGWNRISPAVWYTFLMVLLLLSQIYLRKTVGYSLCAFQTIVWRAH